MNKQEKAQLLFLLGTAVMLGAATYILYACRFQEKDFVLDTYDEHEEDYL